MKGVKKHFFFILFFCETLWESLAADITVEIGLKLRMSVTDEFL
jgi:hypothetical protein